LPYTVALVKPKESPITTAHRTGMDDQEVEIGVPVDHISD
jgi:uncharacterized OB-fold protein